MPNDPSFCPCRNEASVVMRWFKPSQGKEETYDNIARGFRTCLKGGLNNAAKEYAELLEEMDKEFAKEGEQ
jgi:hypothetical protein